MKNKILTLFILGIFLFSFANIMALESLGTFKQGDNVRISQVCNNANYITISSITYPDSTQALNNINMTFSGSGEFYYNFNSTDTLGRYDVRGISDGCENTFATYFEVTSTGLLDNNKIPIYLLIFAVIVIILGFIFKSPPTGFFGGILFVMAGIYLMIYGFGNIADIYTQAFASIVLGFGMLMMIIGLMSFFDDET